MAKIWQLNGLGALANLQFIDDVNNLDTGSQQLPDGVYTTFRTYYHNQVLRLSSHFQRLHTSAELQNCTEKLDFLSIRLGLRQAGKSFSNGDIRYRIHWSISQPENELFLLAEPFIGLPDEYYRTGVQVNTIKMARENPISKSTKFINSTKQIREEKPSNIHEYLMVASNHEILEGMTSNFFSIVGFKVFTASSGILPGITRQLVLEAIDNVKIPLVTNGISENKLQEIQEAFITSASRGILPVTMINGYPIGNGMPGEITNNISLEFTNCLKNALEEI